MQEAGDLAELTQIVGHSRQRSPTLVTTTVTTEGQHRQMPSSDGTHRRMLDQLVRANAVDGKWAEATIAQAETLEDMERAVAAPGGVIRVSCVAQATAAEGADHQCIRGVQSHVP